MRAMWMIICIVFAFAFLGFLVTNVDTRVAVTLLTTRYEAVPLSVVVVMSIVITAVLVGVGAVAEGTKDRFENRRLRRELHKLETEINYLRTQPTGAIPTTLSADAEQTVTPRHKPGGEATLPTAPVYGNEEDDWSPESDDDVYSGGRAV